MRFQFLTSFVVLASSCTNYLIVSAAPLEERAGPTVPYFSGFNIGAGRPDGSCKTPADWEDDFRKIRSWATNEKDKFDTVKLFSTTNCNALANAVPAAIKTNTMIWVGIWPSDETSFGKEKYALQTVIEQHGSNWLKGINVASEALYRKEIDPSKLANYIWDVKGMIQKAFNLPNIPVGTADTWTSWVDGNNVAVISACDIIVMNAFPYWQGEPADKGLETFQQAIKATTSAITKTGLSRPLIIGETGWPSAGNNFGNAIACPTCLQQYYTSTACWLQKNGVGWYWFSAFDEPLKHGEVEKNFGVATYQKTPKINFKC